MQEKNGPLALDGDVPTNLNESLVLVVFGVELLLENLKDRETGLTSGTKKKTGWVNSAVRQLGMELPLKAAMTGEEELALASRSCAASRFFLEHPSPETMQKKSGDAAERIQ